MILAIVLSAGVFALGYVAGFSRGIVLQLGQPRDRDWVPEDVQ